MTMTDRTDHIPTYFEKAADCVREVAKADTHADAVEWIGVGTINALLAIADQLDNLTPQPVTVQHHIDWPEGVTPTDVAEFFERMAKPAKPDPEVIA